MTKLFDITGKTISGEWGSNDDDKTGIPVIRTTNFTNEGNIDYSNVVTRKIKKNNIEKKFLKYGDIIIEKSGGSDNQPVGRVVYFDNKDGKYLFNNFTGLLRVKDTSKWNSRYVFWSLFASYKQGKTKMYQNKTTGLHNLRTDAYVKDLNIKDLSFKSQVNISNILDKARKEIELRKEELAKLDTLIKARFVEMFGDPVKNEKKFLTKQLSQIGKCKNGINFHKSEIGNTVNCLTVKDFENNQVINDTTKLAKIKLSNLPSNDYFLNNGDIVFVRSNGNKSLVGRSVLIFPNNNPTLFSGFCIRFRKDSKRLESVYLLWLLKNESIRMKMRGRGVNIQNLNQQIINNLSIPVPPIELQKEFASFVQQVDKSKVAIQKSLDETQILFDSLMQKYFS